MKIGNLDVYGIIYKITNNVNSKTYIGQTVCGFINRYGHGGSTLIEHVYKFHNYNKNHDYSYNKHLLSSIEKYGMDSFDVIEIFDCAFSKVELDIKESMYINLYNSLNKKYGYNHKEGGGNGKLPEYIVDLMGKSIIQLSLNGNFIKEWETIAKVQRLLELTNISFSDKQSISNSYGFVWVLKDDYDENFLYQFQSSIYNNCIILDEKGNIIKEYSSKKDVMDEFNICDGYFNACAKGNYLLKGKYNLMTKEKYNTGDYTLLTSCKGKYMGKDSPNYNRKHTEKAKENMSKAHVGQKGKEHPMYGKYHTKESLDKMRESKKGQCTGGDNGFATIYEVYNINWELIKVFPSKIQTVEWMVEEKYIGTIVSGKITLNNTFKTPQKPYKGLYFKRYKKLDLNHDKN